MAFPVGWPPRPATGRRSIRVFISGTTTNNFADNAYLFSALTGANTFVPTPYVRPGSSAVVHHGDLTVGGSPSGGGMDPHDADMSKTAPADQPVPVTMIWPQTIVVSNDGLSDIEFSFDGINVHGIVREGEKCVYRERMEAGISVREPGGAAIAFRVEGW